MGIYYLLGAISQCRMQSHGAAQNEEWRIQNQCHVEDRAGQRIRRAIQQGIGQCISRDSSIENLRGCQILWQFGLPGIPN